MPNEIFISYAHRDWDFVKSLIEELKQQGIDPWYDDEDIPKGAYWHEEMLLGVQRCRDFLFIMTPDSIASDYCNEELRDALRHNKRIIPALLHLVGDIELIHPILRSLNWLRFDQDRFKALRQLLNLINSLQGWLGDLSNRPSAIIEVNYFDGTKLNLPLIQDCYWVGRRPNPPFGRAGCIVLPDPDPKNPITSRFHLEIKVVNNEWYAINRSKNNIVLYPPCLDGKLKHNTKIFAGHSYLVYQEINYSPSQKLPQELDEKDTVGEFNG
ncbi:MAG: hypothetical protein Fur006_50390 [Coleofasciculaceae cyanobacterium]